MYKKHTIEEYNQVMDLRKNFGWGIIKISSFLSKKGIYIKKGAMGRWIYRNGKTFDEVLVNKIPNESKELTKEKAYILGVLCGDGYIRVQRHSYLVGLDVCDEDFVDEFIKCFNKTYSIFPSKRIRRRKFTPFTKNLKPQYVINAVSK